ncbi:hypothetical protein [uncultured Draconibacterium sp.]|uniref:hypothetical protein n=1 Tax=uncultured Draconibacterium sp. TaxID=1573823 RepID=UPI0029C97C3C|nr:hypothetical protein [uncultured Draconibacterium sp.]
MKLSRNSPDVGMSFLQDNEPMVIYNMSESKMKYYYNPVGNPEIQYNIHADEFQRLSDQGSIIEPGDIVSVKMGYDFHRGKLESVSDNHINLKIGDTKPEKVNVNELQPGDKVTFPIFDSKFKGSIQDIDDESFHLVNNSGVKFNLHKSELPEEVTIFRENRLSLPIDHEDYKGVYKFKPGQKFDIRELPKTIFELDTKAIDSKDRHQLLQGKQTNQVYELTSSKGEKYPAKFSLKREEGKLRIDVNPKLRELNISDTFTDAEKKELTAGNVIKKSFPSENGEFDSFVKVDPDLNKLAFLSTDNFNNLLDKSGLSKVTEEQKLDLLNGKNISFNRLNSKATFSLDFFNKNILLDKEQKESYSFKANTGLKR